MSIFALVMFSLKLDLLVSLSSSDLNISFSYKLRPLSEMDVRNDMSITQKVKDTVTATVTSTEEFIESTKESLQMQLSKTVPSIQHDLDSSLEEAGRALSNALSSIENKTKNEQTDLLNAYKSFLQKQIAFVDDRLQAIRKIS
jgi:hypothetical protein